MLRSKPPTLCASTPKRTAGTAAMWFGKLAGPIGLSLQPDFAFLPPHPPLPFSKPNAANEVKIVLDLSNDGRVVIKGQYEKTESDWYKMGKVEIQGGKKFVEVVEFFYGGEKTMAVTVGTGSDEDQYESTACSRR